MEKEVEEEGGAAEGQGRRNKTMKKRYERNRGGAGR